MKALVVTTAVADYEAGQMITDRAEMKRLRDSYPGYVVETKAEAAPEADEPAPASKPASSSASPSKPTSADLPAVKSPNAV